MVTVDKAIIARIERSGKHFEILVDPELAYDLREGKSVSLNKMLAINQVFKDAKKVTLKVSENQCVFEEGDVTFISRLIEGSFPDFRAIIPEEGDAHIVVSRTVLLEHLDAATFFTSRLNDVILTITEGGKHLEVRAANNDVGEYTTEIKTEGEAVGETSAAFNIRYLADGVRTLKGETIRIELNGQQRPTVLRPTGDETQDLYLIMPIRTS